MFLKTQLNVRILFLPNGGGDFIFAFVPWPIHKVNHLKHNPNYDFICNPASDNNIVVLSVISPLINASITAADDFDAKEGWGVNTYAACEYSLVAREYLMSMTN
jgi:hypothetical protein